MMYELPKTLEVGGVEYEIRSDYRPVLDICAALNDPEIDDNERGYAVLCIFYPDFEEMPPEHHNEAIQRCFWFIRCGDSGEDKKSPRLMDWEQDFSHIVGPVNRIMGYEVRAVAYDLETNTGGMHWWSFVGAYREIGECFFSQIVSIRSKKAKNKTLDKSEQEFYRQNRDIIDLKTTYTEAEDAILERWGVK